VVGARLKTRADVVTLNVTRDEVLANAPEAMAGFFTVPKVVE
jgi:aspartyl/glutamyl-tRNA(Asn/Gln) amidotransferase C subunit